jgi:hypothetical protein
VSAPIPHAFPNPAKGPYGSEGMTLRDWFAGQAFGAVMGRATGLGALDPEARADMLRATAAVIYEAVDAMLAERANA